MVVVVILIALSVPSLRKARSSAQELTDAVRIKQLGLLVAAYANDFKDLPPVIFSPTYVNPSLGSPWQQATVRGTVVQGGWFSNATKFYYALSPLPSIQAVTSVKAPKGRYTITIGGERTSYLSDFYLADVFYADPDYWTRTGQRGVSQWHPQPISAVAFPSRKGLLWQSMIYDVPGFPSGTNACCTGTNPTAILWADQSVSNEVMSKLNPGVPNGWYHGGPIGFPDDAIGPPVYGTERGILGTDR